jgi:4-carboxymuconolactone decarboxylase
MIDTPTFGRYTELPVEQMTPEQQAGYRLLVDGPRGRLPGPYRAWVGAQSQACPCHCAPR